MFFHSSQVKLNLKLLVERTSPTHCPSSFGRFFQNLEPIFFDNHSSLDLNLLGLSKRYEFKIWENLRGGPILKILGELGKRTAPCIRSDVSKHLTNHGTDLPNILVREPGALYGM